MDSVSIVESLNGICISSCGHEEVTSIDVDKRILLVRDDQLLEIVEGQVVVTEEVSTLASEDVGLVERIIKFKCDREVLHCFIEDAEASIAPSSCQVELTSWLLFLSNGNVEVVQCLVEVMCLVVEQSSEKVQTWLFLINTAALDGNIKEPLGLHHLSKLLVIIHKLAVK